MIDITKTYKTRDGREVRIYATDGTGAYPVHGAIKKNGEWFLGGWTANGAAFLDHEQCRDDLIEVKPRIKEELWMNIYEDSWHTYRTKERANECANDTRLACVKIYIDCDEGDGL